MGEEKEKLGKNGGVVGGGGGGEKGNYYQSNTIQAPLSKPFLSQCEMQTASGLRIRSQINANTGR